MRTQQITGILKYDVHRPALSCCHGSNMVLIPCRRHPGPFPLLGWSCHSQEVAQSVLCHRGLQSHSWGHNTRSGQKNQHGRAKIFSTVKTKYVYLLCSAQKFFDKPLTRQQYSSSDFSHGKKSPCDFLTGSLRSLSSLSEYLASPLTASIGPRSTCVLMPWKSKYSGRPITFWTNKQTNK